MRIVMLTEKFRAHPAYLTLKSRTHREWFEVGDLVVLQRGDSVDGRRKAWIPRDEVERGFLERHLLQHGLYDLTDDMWEDFDV